ncbi:phage major capsid protein [Myxococcota bacterium]|nr:phage major capsid protein [Myxococcota bacterium]MCZ7619404.1 phage major capsid protein [Myxococcota bacterium]
MTELDADLRPGAVVHRVVEIDASRAKADPDALVAVSLSSEEPVRRAFGYEVLSHGPGSVDLERAARGLVLLAHHDPKRPIGRVEAIRLEGRRLRGRLRFGASSLAREIEADVRSGVLQDLSVGYEITKVERDGELDGEPLYRVAGWRPMEASVVSIGADSSVGIGRAQPNFKESTMPDPTPEQRIETRQHDQKPHPIELERERVLDIQAISSRWNCRAVGEKAIREGWPIADFQAWLMKNAVPSAKPLETPSTAAIGMERGQVEKFSILRAAQALATRDWRQAELEREASDQVAKQLGRQPRGFFVPRDVLAAPEQRAVTKAGSGGSIIATDLRPESFIDLLRNATLVRVAGATSLPGLVGNVDISRQTGPGTAQWLTEGGTVTDADPTFDVVGMSPKTVAAKAHATRKMLLQSTPEIEQILRADLARSLALAIDRAALIGSGAGAEPLGLFNIVGVNSVAVGTNGGPLTWAHIVALESAVAGDNAETGALAYMTNSLVRGALKTTEKAASTGLFVWPDRGGDATVNGRRALVSNQVPSNLTKGSGTNLSAVFYGNWRDLLIGEWGIMDVTSEGITLADSGGLTVRAFLDVDIAVRHPESFAIIADAVA